MNKVFKRASTSFYGINRSNPARLCLISGLVYVLLLMLVPFPAVKAASLVDIDTIGQPILFKETGHTLAYNFRLEWKQNGGLANFGYPLTEVFLEDGRPVQYFERARFEWHADLVQVQIGLLGNWVARTHLSEPAFKPIEPPSPDNQVGYYFPETGHTLRFGFLDYWLNKGGLQVFGFPISEEFREVNPQDNHIYTVQYFERARFEYHPDLPTGYQVLLGQLGKTYLEQQNNAPAWTVSRVMTTSVAWQYIKPTRIQLPRLGLDTEVVEGGFSLKAWDVPRFTAVHYWPISAFPGSAGNIILAGHAGYKNTIFDQLPQAIIGDDIIIFIGQTQKHYQVKSLKIVLPTDTGVLAPASQEVLTLITCVPPGLYTSRLIVQAVPVEKFG